LLPSLQNSDASAPRECFVIAELDPAIHAALRLTMDHRVKPGGDEV
jgi:hypothetical protein